MCSGYRWQVFKQGILPRLHIGGIESIEPAAPVQRLLVQGSANIFPRSARDGIYSTRNEIGDAPLTMKSPTSEEKREGRSKSFAPDVGVVITDIAGVCKHRVS